MTADASAQKFSRPTASDGFALDRVIVRIDELVSAQIDEIIRHAKFRKLEASWRGLLHLISVSDEVDGVEVRMLSVTWLEICRDLERASSFDQSVLFQKIYEEEFGVAGGEPFGLLLGDYQISHLGQAATSLDDVEALTGLAKIASAAFAPFVTAASPELLGLDAFSSMRPVAAKRNSGPVGLAGPRFLSEMRSDPAYSSWRSLRAAPESRFVGVALPHYLLRSSEYCETPRQGFLGRLSREAPGREDQLWGASVYAFGAVVAASYGRSGWFTDMRGSRREDPGSGLVPGLSAREFATDGPKIAEIPPIEVEIDHAQAAALDELGLIPLLRATNTADLLFDSNCSLYASPSGGGPLARSSARLSTMLQYVLCVSRFAHYIKVLGRDQIGVRATAASCQEGIQRWIRQYTTSDDEASPVMLARSPLREALIQVRERPGHPGSFICAAQLKPHFQLDQISAAFEIVTDIAGLSSG